MTSSVPEVLPLDASLQQAIAYHQTGRLAEAEQVYRAVLHTEPGQAIANHNLGLLLGQIGEHAAALPYLKAALEADPDQALFWLSFADALLANGQAEDALDTLRNLVQHGLDTPATLALLEKAEAAVSNLSAPPDSPSPADIDRLVESFNGGRHAELESRARLLIEQYPESGFAWSVLGTALQLQGKDALPAYRKTAQLSPYDSEAHGNLGNALQASGQHEAAVVSYCRALEINPEFAQAHTNLGSALQALGRFEDAVASHRKALGIAPDYVAAHFNLANAFKEFGQFDDAVASYRRALELEPADAEAHRNLGNALQLMGKPDEAVACYLKALEILPHYAEAHNNLGGALSDLGKMDEALASYQRALGINPDYAEAHTNLGNALQALGQLEDAVTSYRRALEIAPDNPLVHIVVANALLASGKLDDAVTSYQTALEISPADAVVHRSLGAVLKKLGHLDRAAASYRRSLDIDADHAETHSNLGVILETLGQCDEAVASYRRSLEINPGFIVAHVNLGNALQTLDRNDDAVASYRRALEIDPDFAAAHSNLGVVLQALGQDEDAVASYRRALELKPDLTVAHSNLGSALQSLGHNADAVASCRRALELEPDNSLANSNLLFFLSHIDAPDARALFAEHCRFADRFEAALRPNWPQHANARDPDRCLQIGFVSGDLRNHAVANFIEPVLAHLARRPGLSLHGYSNLVSEDDVTRRLRGHLAHWHQVAGLSDAALAQQIREDGIDVLIDLSGHTAHNRLPAFARKPAPLQASWIGYPGTTGLQAMDYYLGDRFLLPPGQFDDQFTEKLVFLPANAPFLPSPVAPPVNQLPALTNGYLTFGSFNRPGKLSRTVIGLWSRLLRALPDARMLLGAMPEDGNNANLIDWFAEEGIARERLSFHPRSDISAYLALHHLVDVCLDTFPYTGGTTNLHALWMGVPTLTIAGQTVAGRSGAAILWHTGLQALVARDMAEFVQRGVYLARDISMLAKLRTGMRERLEQSATGQPAVIADGLETALRTMWQRWCAGLPAESFEAFPHHSGFMEPKAAK